MTINNKTMNKIYIAPDIRIVPLRTKTGIMNITSVRIEKTNTTTEQLGRQDNSWDIWGSDDEME